MPKEPSDQRRPVESPEAGVYEAFLGLYSKEQGRIQAYIRSLVPDPTDADDLFQKTSLVMWRSFASFDRAKPFLPWALGVARHQILVHWRTRRRDRHIFSESFLTTLADELGERLTSEAAALIDRQRALDACVEQLPPRQQELIRRFYGDNEQAGAIAASWNRSVHAVYKALKVMRKGLQQCIEERLGQLDRQLPGMPDTQTSPQP